MSSRSNTIHMSLTPKGTPVLGLQIKEAENGAFPAGDEEKQNRFCSLEPHGFVTSNKHGTTLFRLLVRYRQLAKRSDS